MGEGVEVLEGDGVDFVIDVDAFDVGAVVAHYYVDELVDCCCDWVLACTLGWRAEGDEEFHTILISNKDLDIQHAVVSEDVVEHLLIKILRWRCECDLHTASLFLLEIDIRWFLVESDSHCL